ncbi:hypothetical protein DZC34_02560, partial [Clostridium botulinum]
MNADYNAARNIAM